MGGCTQDVPRSLTRFTCLHPRARCELPVPVFVGSLGLLSRTHTVPGSRIHVEVGRVSGRS